MEYSDKPKKRKLLPRQRPSVIILEALIVIVAVVAAGRYLFGTPPAPTPTVDAAMLYEQGETFLEAKEYMQAVDAFTQAIVAGYTPVSMAYFERGRAHYDLEDYQAAVEDFTLSLKYDAPCEEDCHVDYYNRALAYENLGDNGAALDDYTAAIARNESYFWAYQNRGDLYFSTGNSAAGLRDWQQALRITQTGRVQRGLTEGGGTRQADITEAGQQVYFTFEAGAGDKITLFTEKSTFDTVLLLLDDADTALAFADTGSGGESEEAKITAFVLPEDGRYTAVVAAYNGKDTGKFTLTMQVEKPASLAPDVFSRITPGNAALLTEYSQFTRSSTGTTAWSADGRFFLEDSIGNGVLLYDTAVTDPRYRQVVSFDKAYGALAMTPDNSLLALGEGKNVLLYDVETGTRTAVLRDSKVSINALTFSPDGTLLAANGSFDRVFIWDTTAGKLARTLISDNIASSNAAFSSDSRLLAMGGADGRLELWNVQTGDLLRVFTPEQPGEITMLVFSPNGERLAAGTEKGAVLLYDVSSGELVAEYSGQRGSVSAVVFSPDGRLLASAGSDGKIYLWSLDATEALVVLAGHEKAVQTIAFREDGRVLVSAGADGTVRLWRVK